MNLKTSIVEIDGIGKEHAALLNKLEIFTMEDLLWYLPFRWDDYSRIVNIRDVKTGEVLCVYGEVQQISNKISKKGLNITEAIIADETGTLKVVWFNQPYLQKTFKKGDKAFFAGKIDFNYGGFNLQSPSYEKITSSNEGESVTRTELIHVGGLIPVYHETEGISSKWLRSRIKPIMKYIYSIKDYLPESVKGQYDLIGLPAAIRQMHFPENLAQIKKARERLDFDELFLLQIEVLNARKNLRSKKAIAIPFNEDLSQKFVQGLGFTLTNSQRKAAWEIVQDCSKSEPMNRLLQGDVGSGKTVVAALAMANVAANSAQSVLLCPTEILAKQHFAKVSKMLEPLDISCALITGSMSKAEKDELITKIYEGEVLVIIGTHAVLNQNIKFWRLGLAIIDEQHRFGVEQRSALRKESGEIGTLPHFLSMTATPIPRTLTLTVFGDLDISVLNELPPGRKKVITKIVPENKRADSHKFIKEEIQKGGQAYIVCPLVEDKDEETDKKSVLGEYENYKSNIFPDIEIGYVYGGMKAKEKESVMSDFLDGKIKILIASSVIEVGVDVPNASIIVVEDADRFGLAQLHQLRGRVGRGDRQSYCFLYTKSISDIAVRRLDSITKIDDGFKLAEVDLELRGPGEVLGIRQHGVLGIRAKNLTNVELIRKCRMAATKFLENNDLDNYPLLKEKSKSFNYILNLE